MQIIVDLDLDNFIHPLGGSLKEWQAKSVVPRVRPNRQESDDEPLLKRACQVILRD